MNTLYWLPLVVFLAHIAEEGPRFPQWATRHFGATSRAFYFYSHLVLVAADTAICWLAAMTGWIGSCSTPTSRAGATRAGLGVWWRRWHQDGDTGLDHEAVGRPVRPPRARIRFGHRGIAVIGCGAGERRHGIAEEHPRAPRGRACW